MQHLPAVAPSLPSLDPSRRQTLCLTILIQPVFTAMSPFWEKTSFLLKQNNLVQELLFDGGHNGTNQETEKI